MFLNFLIFFFCASISSAYCFRWCLLRCVKRLDMFLLFASTGFFPHPLAIQQIRSFLRVNRLSIFICLKPEIIPHWWRRIFFETSSHIVKTKWQVGVHVSIHILVIYGIPVSPYKNINSRLILVQIKYRHIDLILVYHPALIDSSDHKTFFNAGLPGLLFNVINNAPI